MTRKLVVVIDTQADFMLPGGALYVPGAEQLIVPMMHHLASLKPDETVAVLFTMDTHLASSYAGSEEAQQFPPHCIAGTPGHANLLSHQLVNEDIDVGHLNKRVFDMWANVDALVCQRQSGSLLSLEQSLRHWQDFGEEPITVEIFGVASDYCVRYALQGFVNRGFTVNVVERLCAHIATPINQVIREVTENKQEQSCK